MSRLNMQSISQDFVERKRNLGKKIKIRLSEGKGGEVKRSVQGER